MKWRLVYAMFGAVVGYCIFLAQNAAVHGELALEIHRNRVMADRAEKAEMMEREQFRERLAVATRLWCAIREERDTARESRERLVRAYRAAMRQRWACRCHADAPSISESKAREIVALLEKWESQGEGSKVVNLDFAKGVWYCLDELKDVLYAPSKGHV